MIKPECRIKKQGCMKKRLAFDPGFSVLYPDAYEQKFFSEK